MPKKLFDRKTFDPINNHYDSITLTQLRSMGARRMRDMSPSTAMLWAMKECKGGVLIDCGCGDSADVVIANNRGFSATGLDLFRPSHSFNFVIADVVERIPMDDSSVDVVVCQAMLDLVEPVARTDFFCEVHRVLVPGGILCCYIQWLEPGWGFSLEEEMARASKLFDVDNRTSGFIGRKQ